jgi:hypothetical protein
VLHTWGQTLTEHVHVHCLVSAGGLSLDGQNFRRIPKRRRPFLFPVKALSPVFRDRFLRYLRRLHRSGKLCFAAIPPSTTCHRSTTRRSTLKRHEFASH